MPDPWVAGEQSVALLASREDDACVGKPPPGRVQNDARNRHVRAQRHAREHVHRLGIPLNLSRPTDTGVTRLKLFGAVPRQRRRNHFGEDARIGVHETRLEQIAQAFGQDAEQRVAAFLAVGARSQPGKRAGRPCFAADCAVPDSPCSLRDIFRQAVPASFAWVRGPCCGP